MLRPSRPMMRPFISSDGMGTVLTVASAVWSTMTRWMAVMTTSRARSSALSRADRSMARTRRTASCSASSRTCSTRTALASFGGEPADALERLDLFRPGLASSLRWYSSSCSRLRQLAVALLEHVRTLVELLVALEQPPLEVEQVVALGAPFLVQPRDGGGPAPPWPGG